MTPFALDGPLALTGAVVDRDDPLRDDGQCQRDGWKTARVLVLDEVGQALATTADQPELIWCEGADFGVTPPPEAVLLGRHEGVAYWAVRRPEGHRGAEGDVAWRGLRALGLRLSDAEIGLFTAAVGVLGWHDHNRFCGRCGGRNAPARAGWMSRCVDCGTEEYPRTDPAVICLLHDGIGVNGERILLARGPSWPRNRMSVLAGFVEPGESLEDCVRREVREEVGIDVRDLRYLGSQPWPLPRSLMIGFAGVADPDQPLRLQDGEIAQARWYSRSEILAALSRAPDAAELTISPTISISYRMIRSWAYAG